MKITANILIILKMEVTQEYLDSRSLQELKNLAKSRGLITSGNKKQLVDRVLNYEKEDKSKNRPIETSSGTRNPENLITINGLPLDIQALTALNLPYEDVLRLCKLIKS